MESDSFSTNTACLERGRRVFMALLARAQTSEIAAGIARLGDLPEHSIIREPEIGLVMIRARVGGDGAPFNLGEATVTRSAVQLASGIVGLSYALGRDVEKARLAALCDALWQNEEYRESVEMHVAAPIRGRVDAERALACARTAATRVEFFTMVRGEDAT